MNEFKSKTNIPDPDYVIRMKARYSLSRIWKLEVSTFKSINSNRKQIFSDYVILMKLKRGTVSPVSESLKCLLLNERIQIENEHYLIMSSVWN